MTFRSFCLSFAVAAAAAGMVLVSVPGPALADAKIVTRTSSSGGMAGARPGSDGSGATSTSYYKGDKVRVETGNNVMIYDCAADRLYTLDTAKKTYTVATLQQLASQPNPMMQMIDIQSTVSMKPGGKTKTISGKRATNYVWKATLTMKLKKGTNLPQGAAPPTLPTIIMEGEQWTTTALKTSAKCGRLPAAAMMSAGGMPPGLKKLIDLFATIKGVPLSSRMTQRMKMSGGAPAGMPAGADRTMTVTSSVVSLSEATLPASLFAVPAGYKQVPRSSPGMPMGGRPGRAPARR